MDKACKLMIKEVPEGFVIKVFVQPRSSKNEIAGLYEDALKIKLKAPPVDGAANKMCLEFLAKLLGLPKSSLKIVSGLSSRNKQIFIPAKGRSGNIKDSLLSLVG